MERAALVLVLLGCGGVGAGDPSPPPEALPAGAADPDGPQPQRAACSLDWEEERAAMPAELVLLTWLAAVSADECPSAFDASAALDACAAPDCVAGFMAPGRPAALVIEGPSGSGRFVTLGLAVGGDPRGPLFTCLLGSTVGWRHFAAQPAARNLAPLPWLSDADGDGAAELIVWHRVSWGSSEIENGLVPAAYRLDGDRLVRRDAAASPLARQVAAAYRSFIGPPTAAPPPGPIACYAALADALDRWDTR